jgi:toxin ParE1/3/4
VIREIVKHPQATDDLIGCFASINERSGAAAADRFLRSVETTLTLLASSPGIGAPHRSDNPRVAGLRCFRVSKFKNHLLFYRAFDDRVELVRVFHGARDFPRLLDNSE